MTNERLVIRVKAGEQTAENMMQLWRQNKAFVAKVAKCYNGYVEMDDLMQEGYIALCEAVEHYEIDKGVLFISYAGFWIKQRLHRYAERSGTVRLPSGIFQNVVRYKRICKEYAKECGCEPSDVEMRHLLGIDREALDKVKYASQIGQIRSLNDPIGEDCGCLTLGEVVASDQNLEEDVIQKRDHELMSRALKKAVEEFSERQALVIYKRYWENESQEKIGEMLHCSGSMISSLEKTATRALKKSRRSPAYCAYWENYITPYPIRRVSVRSFQRSGYSEVERAVLGWDS